MQGKEGDYIIVMVYSSIQLQSLTVLHKHLITRLGNVSHALTVSVCIIVKTLATTGGNNKLGTNCKNNEKLIENELAWRCNLVLSPIIHANCNLLVCTIWDGMLATYIYILL